MLKNTQKCNSFGLSNIFGLKEDVPGNYRQCVIYFRNRRRPNKLL